MNLNKPNFFGVFKRRALDSLKHLVARFPWHDSVKSIKRLVGLLQRSLSIVVGRVGTSNALAVLSFARLCNKLWRDQGYNGLVKYLKAAQICLMKAMAGQTLEDTRSVGGRVSRTLSGVPRCIPSAHRERIIRFRDPQILRLWMTLFGLYRVLEVSFPVVSLRTIYTPGVDFQPIKSQMISFVPQFYDLLGRTFGLSKLLSVGVDWTWKWSLNVSSGTVTVSPVDGKGPSERGSLQTVFAQAEALVQSSFWPVFDRFLEVLDHYDLRDQILRFSQASLFIYEDAQDPRTGKWSRPFSWTVGKLALKVEAAGKVRVFAIVDYFTQGVLKPLHDFLFEVLRAIPQDGTFNQHKPLRRLVANGHRNCFSFDLSAATDRLPLSLQESLLSHLLSPKVARAWADLFRLRDFKVPSDSTLEFLKVRKSSQEDWGDSVRYATGQPMGALSSWAMLALTHHYIVQLAAFRAGFKEWFTEYAVLGDDVVICDPSVAGCYLEIMKILGVPLNLSKSVIARNSVTMEFAKRFIVDGVDVSAVALNEVAAASASLAALAELFKDRATNQMSSALASMLKFMGKGYKVSSRICSPWATQNQRVAWLLAYMRSPWGVWPMLPSVWFTAIGVNSTVSRLTQQTRDLVLDRILEDHVDPMFEHWYEPVIEHVLLKDVVNFNIYFSTLHKLMHGEIELPEEFSWVPDTVMELLFDLEEGLEGNFYIREQEADSLRDSSEFYRRKELTNVDDLFAAVWNAKLNFSKVPRTINITQREDFETPFNAGSWLRWYVGIRALLTSVETNSLSTFLEQQRVRQESPADPFRVWRMDSPYISGSRALQLTLSEASPGADVSRSTIIQDLDNPDESNYLGQTGHLADQRHSNKPLKG